MTLYTRIINQCMYFGMSIYNVKIRSHKPTSRDEHREE